MCGRFSLYEDDDEVAARFEAEAPAEGWRKSWNIAPTQRVSGVRRRWEGDPGGEGSTVRQLARFRWGLLGPWVTDPAKAGSTFNARAETVATKPTFRGAFRTRRLLIPANSYFEWRRQGRERQPHCIRRADGDLLAFAGLWQEWHDPADKSRRLLTATIVTTGAGPDTADLHDRQPVVLEPDQWEAWLDPARQDVADLEALLRPSPAGTLVHFVVDRRVGRVTNDDPDCVAPLDPPSPRQPPSPGRPS